MSGREIKGPPYMMEPPRHVAPEVYDNGNAGAKVLGSRITARPSVAPRPPRRGFFAWLRSLFAAR